VREVQSVASRIGRDGNAAGRASCSAARKDRVLVRFMGHMYDLMIWPRRVSIKSLGRRHNVSRRTLLRDFAKLRENGIPVKFDSQGSYYYLPPSYLNASGSQDLLDVTDSDRSEAISVPEWPLRWSETVALFAILDGAKTPDGSELDLLSRRARDQLIDWVNIILGDRAGSVFSNAKLLVKEPTLSISELHKLMERFWSRKENSDSGGHVPILDAPTPVMARFESYAYQEMSKKA
jgi:hypothetical protein